MAEELVNISYQQMKKEEERQLSMVEAFPWPRKKFKN